MKCMGMAILLGRKRVVSVVLGAILVFAFFGNVNNNGEFLVPTPNRAVLENQSVTTTRDDQDRLLSMHQRRFYRHHHESMMALIHKSTILEWKPRQNPMGFRPFFDFFQEEDLPLTSRKFKAGDICRSAKMLLRGSSEPRPHVLFLTPFDENWGRLSTRIPNRTSQFWDLDREWKRNDCDRSMILKFLNHPTTRAVITVQFQDLDHPKVHSIPLGLTTPQASAILDLIHQPPPVGSSSGNIDNRTQLLMINSQPRAMRLQILETVQRNFNGTVQNTYGSGDLKHYYHELTRSKFILSPGGLGLDCYRHWEALYLGTIPVLEHLNRTDGWFRTLRDLPVAWIDSYDHLTPSWLQEEYGKIIRRVDTYRYQKLTRQYWIDLIRSFEPSDTAATTNS